jgi:hypothetical protein
MHLLPDYPAAAFAQHAQDICQMHVTVSATGAVSAVEFTQSTGSAALDQSFLPSTAVRYRPYRADRQRNLLGVEERPH